jgi:hypothetical protein
MQTPTTAKTVIKKNCFIFYLTFTTSRYFSFPPFALMQKVEPKNQGCQKSAKNARFRLKKNKSQR